MQDRGGGVRVGHGRRAEGLYCRIPGYLPCKVKAKKNENTSTEHKYLENSGGSNNNYTSRVRSKKRDHRRGRDEETGLRCVSAGDARRRYDRVERGAGNSLVRLMNQRKLIVATARML